MSIRFIQPHTKHERPCIFYFAILSILSATFLQAFETAKAGQYEDDLAGNALKETCLEIEDSPGGKIIEGIILVRYPVVGKNDPWPKLLNMFHVTTRDKIIRQELLFHEGERYDESTVRESARNLRAMPMIFSMVRILAVKGSAPDRVLVLVVTKDLWSIRLNTNFNFGGGVFNFVSFLPTEQNLLGLNQQLSLYARVDRKVLTFGQLYRVPRVLGSRIAMNEAFALRINRFDGDLEGGLGWLTIRRPLFSLSSRYSWEISSYFDTGIERYFQGATQKVITINYKDQSYKFYHMYDYEKMALETRLGISFGHVFKTDFYFGYRAKSNKYCSSSSLDHVPAPVADAYKKISIPPRDQAGEIFARIAFFEARYSRQRNIDTYGLTEDVRLGPSLVMEAAHASPVLGFDQYSVSLSAIGGYRLLIGNNILWVGLSYSARWWPDSGMEGAHSFWIDRNLEVEFENITPMLFDWFRILSRIHFSSMDYSRSLSIISIGGNNGLRGFQSDFRSGTRALNINIEVRSRPFIFKTLHFGLAAFYDAGDAWMHELGDSIHYNQSLGIGIRALFPQFDRGVVRLDFGFPLGGGFSLEHMVTFSYLQAF
ncbi:MAG: BamA/TamA family outer membrane protein [Deltaproteobacteria bacterium]|nr:BamA/TamA family outer membrane protein [Deltaproteobacteria bacterium]